MQNLRGAQPVVVLHGPLQRRLGECLVLVRLIAEEQDLVQRSEVANVLEKQANYVWANL